MTPICIYHGNCADGFGAAWAVWKAHHDWDFHPGVYQDPPPDVTARAVVLVDFSYKRPVLEEMAQSAKSILVLDHHQSARDDLAGYPAPPIGPVDEFMGTRHVGWLPDSGVYATFDMNKSGAMLAWEHFHVGPPPRLLEHIQDRDLWRFALPGTREIQAALFSHPYDFETWDRLMSADCVDLEDDGRAIERKHFRDIENLLPVVTRRMTIAGHDVPVANLPITMTSDAGHRLATGELFAACYWDTPDGRVFSLRSTDDGLDVSEIAKGYGGGGHRNAAGFRVPLQDLAAGDLA